MQRSTVTPANARRLTPRDGVSPNVPIKLESPANTFRYAHRLNMYTKPIAADTEVALEQFEEWAIDRMEVLDKLDMLSPQPFAEIERGMREILKSNLPLAPNGPGGQGAFETRVQLQRMKDELSHFILRLAFCSKAEDRNRFVRLETLLFKVRFDQATLEERRHFVESLGLSWARATPDELVEFEKQLRFQKPESTEPLGNYYKADMEEVMDLIARYQVVLHKGKAFVPESHHLTLLSKEFSRQLQLNLLSVAKHRAQFQDDSRIRPVLQLASNGCAKSQYSGSASSIDGKFVAESMDSLDADRHLPLCTSALHRNLKKTRHAFNAERLQYQRFLKHIGMPVDEAIRLFRIFYADFEKKKSELEYGIRYQYGLVGARKDYGPMSCAKIYKDGTTAQPNQVHGCPFHRLGPEALETLLRTHGISDPNDISEVKRFSAESKPHLACTKTYELTHSEDKTSYENSIRSPNEYFERSWNFAQRKAQQAS